MAAKEPKPKSHGDREALLVGLLAGRTLEQAAEAAGMSRSTAARYLADGGGRELLEEMRVERRARIMDALAAAASEATTVLRRIMLDRQESSQVRVSAAKALLGEHRGALDSAVKERLAASAEGVAEVATDVGATLAKIRQKPELVAQIAAAAHAVEDALGD